MSKRISTKKKFFLFGAAAAASAGVIWLIKQRQQNPGSLSAWQNVLAQNHGAEGARQIANNVNLRYRELLGERPLPKNMLLRRHLTGTILPGLALYQVLLLEHGGDQKAAAAELDQAFRVQTINKNRLLMAPFQSMSDPFRWFRVVFPVMMKMFPKEGWDFRYEENSDRRIVFNNYRCFYLETLTAYGAPELCASFCATDDVQAELFPSGIRFQRDHTLGRGDDVCDFQYFRG